MRSVDRLQFLYNKDHRTVTISIWRHWRTLFGPDLNLFPVGGKPCTSCRPLATHTQEWWNENKDIAVSVVVGL